MSFKNKIFIISMVMIVLLSVSFASAAQDDALASDNVDEALASTEEEIQREAFDDNVSASNQDALSESEWTYEQLQHSVDTAKDTGATLTLNHDYRYNGGDTGHISITGTTTIDGNNHYISGNGEKSIFRFDDAEDGITLTLKNIIFKNGRSDNGGVIHTKTNVNIYIINCTFIDNSAGEDGGAIYFDSTGTLDIKDSRFERCIVDVIDEGNKKHNGGAINVHGGGKLTIDNSIFKNNIAGFGYGGAVYVEGECREIKNSIFENNTARSRFGGAVYVESDNANGLVVDNCSFTNNTGITIDRKSVCGGAIHYDGTGRVRLLNSNFTNNNLFGNPTYNKDKYQASRAFYDSKGGAVFAAHDIEIGNCKFIKNHAIDMGGAVYTNGGIYWLDDRSIFISNTGGYANAHIANKGGAIYASKFLNDAKGLVFIDNHCWYGGAIYINNNNEVTFESCVFINNSVWNSDGKAAPGAAIYMDSSSSKVSLINNIFYNNHGTEDRGVYNCGKYGTIKNNWYGYNDVNFDDNYIIEWHRIGSNDKKQDSNSLRITLSANATEVFHSSVKLTLKFVCSDKTEFNGKLTNWTVDFKSNNNGKFSDLKIGDNEATVIFTPEAGDHIVSARVHGETVTLKLTQMSDFAWLQQQVDATPSGGVLNLNRNLTYNPDLEMSLNRGIKITKPITINGNGYTINGVNEARIFSIHSNDVKINNITFVNGYGIEYLDESGGAIFIDGVKNVNIANSRFMNNKAYTYGGAIGIRNGDSIQISNSQFISNSAKIGGAIHLDANNVAIDNCEFRYNSASGDYDLEGFAGAINDLGKNMTVSNSIFLNNKAQFEEFNENISDNKLTITLVGNNNYINAIWSKFGDVKFSNVTYWDGKITTGDNPICSQNESGQNITLEIFNKDQKLIKKVTLMTDINGQVTFDFSSLEKGNYTYKATHFDDIYYSTFESNGEFNLTKSKLNESAVKINLPDGKEFEWGKCNISFEITNRTTVDVLVTNEDESFYFEVQGTELNYIILDLPASDKEYYICVYNYGNETVEGNADYKTFKILKVNSTVTVNPVSNVDYGKNVSVSFTGDGTSYNVTVYDKNSNPVFSKIINETSIDISNLAAGEYNVTVVNLGNTNRTQSKASTTFKVNAIDNNIKVDVTNATYSKDITVTVTADADGEYMVTINSTHYTVYVENGKGTMVIDDLLNVGTYYANVTFDNANYVNKAINTTFKIQKAQSNVVIVGLSGNVTWNTSKSIRFTDFYPFKYNVTIYDSENKTIFTNISSSLLFDLPQLEPGQYNLTVVNLGNDNVIGSENSCIFNVVKDNYVIVYAEDADYGRDLLIYIEADVDGTYTVDINGTEIEIEVVNGTGSYWGEDYLLDAGNYTTKVIFNTPGYNNIVDNDNFTVYEAVSNLEIYPIDDVTYGNDVFVRFYDDYPTSYYIEVLDENNTVVFNTTFAFESDEQEMSIILADFAAGEYIINIAAMGDENIIPTGDSTTFNVTKLTPVIYVNADDVIYPDEVVVNVLVNVNGTYYISLAGQTVKADLIAGEVYDVVFSGVEVGNYTITVTYPETENYTAAVNSEIDVEVFDFEFDIDSETTGENTTLSIHVPANATGKIVVTVNGQNYTADVVNGTAEVTIPDLKDDDEILISFISDGKYPNKTQNTTNALINSTILSSNMTRGYNSGMDFQATIVDGSNRPIANATVTITINSKKYTVVSDANGLITINQKLAVGTYTVTLTNPFNNKETTSTLKILTRITGNKNVDTYYGKNYQYKLRIIGDDGNPAGANVAVKVTINGKVKTLKTDKNGYITVKFTKAYLPKTYKVTAEYKEIKVSNNVKVKKVLTLKKVKVKKSAKKLKLTATLKEGKKAIKNKKVTFKFNGKKYKAKTNKKGVAKVIIKKKVLKKLKVGKKVKYQVTYLKHTVKRTVKVKR